MRRFFTAVFCGSMVLASQACVSVRSTHGYVIESDQGELAAEVGFDTKESVLARFGEPSVRGTFNENAWYYINFAENQRAFFTPETQRREVVAFYFDENDVVASVSDYSLQDGQNIDLVAKVTPTRGKEYGFWEQLFGSIGQLPTSALGEGQNPGGGAGR